MPKPFNKAAFFTLITSLSVFANPSIGQQAQDARVATKDLVEGIKSRDGRWFEVEMIIFERFDNQDFREHFNPEIKVLEPARKWDILRHQLQPDIRLIRQTLTDCHQSLDPFSSAQENLSAGEFFAQVQNYKILVEKDWQITNQLCQLPDESLSLFWRSQLNFAPIAQAKLLQVPLDTVPEQVTGIDHDDFHDVYLLAEQNLQLTEHFYTLKRNRKLNPLLHIGWRQPGLSKRRSIPVYLLAGQNYSANYRYDGSQILSSDDVMSEPETNETSDATSVSLSPSQTLTQSSTDNVQRFMQQLQSGAVVDFGKGQLVYPDHSTLPEHAWQIDGTVQIHLNHYLFINAEFNYRQVESTLLDVEQMMQQVDPISQLINQQQEPSSELDQDNESQLEVNYLQNYYFKQNRRVYSGDIHYLDHPKFGILIQIRKYRH